MVVTNTSRSPKVMRAGTGNKNVILCGFIDSGSDVLSLLYRANVGELLVADLGVSF